MTIDRSGMPYRPCVGVVLFHPDGRVWAGRRLDGKYAEHAGTARPWQFPQGGIDRGEEPEPAARRELYEETGVSSVSLLAQTADWLTYDLPPDAPVQALAGKYRGQRQMWFAYRFEGEESEIRISPPPDGHAAEFDAWEWVGLAEMPERIVAFKRPVYDALVEEFKGLVA